MRFSSALSQTVISTRLYINDLLCFFLHFLVVLINTLQKRLSRGFYQRMLDHRVYHFLRVALYCMLSVTCIFTPVQSNFQNVAMLRQRVDLRKQTTIDRSASCTLIRFYTDLPLIRA